MRDECDWDSRDFYMVRFTLRILGNFMVLLNLNLSEFKILNEMPFTLVSKLIAWKYLWGISKHFCQGVI